MMSSEVLLLLPMARPLLSVPESTLALPCSTGCVAHCLARFRAAQDVGSRLRAAFSWTVLTESSYLSAW